MRSVALALLLTLLAVAPAAAGIESWGFRAGWSGARLGGDGGSVIAPDYRSDFTGTWFVTVPLRSGISFQPEVSWVTKGGQDDFRVTTFPSPTEVTYTDLHVEHRLHYLEVPLLIRFELPAVGPLRPFALGGTAPAWLVGEDDSEMAITGSTTGPSKQAAVPSRATRIRAQIFEELGTVGQPIPAQTFDFGLVGGLGFWVGEGHVRFGLEGRYTHGLLDMVPGGSFEFENQAFGVTTAIEIR
jgi:hypothetical protein